MISSGRASDPGDSALQTDLLLRPFRSLNRPGEGSLDRAWRITGYIADLTIEAEQEIVLGMQTRDEDLILKHLDDRVFVG